MDIGINNKFLNSMLDYFLFLNVKKSPLNFAGIDEINFENYSGKIRILAY